METREFVEGVANRVYTNLACMPIHVVDESLPYVALLDAIRGVLSYQMDMVDPIHYVLLESYPEWPLLLDQKRMEYLCTINYQRQEWCKGLFLRYGRMELL